PMASMFYAWQIVRMFFLYIIVARACEDRSVPQALLMGLAIGIWVEVGASLLERLSGTLQTGGTVGDKNLLGLMIHFGGLTWFSLLLSGRKGIAPILAPIGSAATAVLTVSRAAIGLTMSGMALIFVVSALRKWTRRKAIVAISSAAVFLVLFPIAI